MKDKLLLIWKNISSSYWFIPACMIIGVCLLLRLMIHFDSTSFVEKHFYQINWINVGSVEDASRLLITIVGSLMTVVAMLVSMIMVVFTLASSQYGPQNMKNFMEDRWTQIVLGGLFSNFIYCLLVLRFVGTINDHHYVPHLSITLALVLTIIDICILLYYVHHSCSRILPQNVIGVLANSIKKSVCDLYPEEIGQKAEDDEVLCRNALKDIQNKCSNEYCVKAQRSGFLQAVSQSDFMKLLEKNNLFVEVFVSPGDFVLKNQKICRVCFNQDIDDEVLEELKNCFIIGKERTSHQDIRFNVEKVVEVGVKALSPGINEPFVCILSLNTLYEIFLEISFKKIPSRLRKDSKDETRALMNIVSYRELLELFFSQIIYFSDGNELILNHMRTKFSMIIELIDCVSYKEAIQEYVSENL